MTGEQHIFAETDLEPAGKRLIRLSLAFAVQPETRRAVMLNLKRKAIAIAIPAALASAQSSSPVFRTVVNPDDSDYRGPVVLDKPYQDKATAAPRASSSPRFRVVVNPEDSGYLGPVEYASASMPVIRR